MKLILISLLLGLGLTLGSACFSYEFCLNGQARGLPFAVYLPRCEATVVSFCPGWDRSNWQIVDCARLFGDVLLWGGVAAVVQHLVARRRAR